MVRRLGSVFIKKVKIDAITLLERPKPGKKGRLGKYRNPQEKSEVFISDIQNDEKMVIFVTRYGNLVHILISNDSFTYDG